MWKINTLYKNHKSYLLIVATAPGKHARTLQTTKIISRSSLAPKPPKLFSSDPNLRIAANNEAPCRSNYVHRAGRVQEDNIYTEKGKT